MHQPTKLYARMGIYRVGVGRGEGAYLYTNSIRGGVRTFSPLVQTALKIIHEIFVALIYQKLRQTTNILVTGLVYPEKPKTLEKNQYTTKPLESLQIHRVVRIAMCKTNKSPYPLVTSRRRTHPKYQTHQPTKFHITSALAQVRDSQGKRDNYETTNLCNT